MFDRIKAGLEHRIKKSQEVRPIVEEMNDEDLLIEIDKYAEKAAKALELLGIVQPLYKD